MIHKILPKKRRHHHRWPGSVPHPGARPGNAMPFYPLSNHRTDGLWDSARVISTCRMKENESPYADMLDIAYPFPFSHPHMSMEKRAAQFMPFAALSGMTEMFEETKMRSDIEQIIRIWI